MKVLHDFLDQSGNVYRFRRRHPLEHYAGRSGMWALLILDDFQFHLAHIEAANDLAICDEPAILSHPMYRALSESNPVAVAVCMMSCDECARLAAKSISEKQLPRAA
jgi:hypothetical protein